MQKKEYILELISRQERINMEKQVNFFKKASTKFIMGSTIPVIVLVFVLILVLFNDLKNKAFATYSIFSGSITNGI